jgi:hypothetical protein
MILFEYTKYDCECISKVVKTTDVSLLRKCEKAPGHIKMGKIILVCLGTSRLI